MCTPYFGNTCHHYCHVCCPGEVTCAGSFGSLADGIDYSPLPLAAGTVAQHCAKYARAHGAYNGCHSFRKMWTLIWAHETVTTSVQILTKCSGFSVMVHNSLTCRLIRALFPELLSLRLSETSLNQSLFTIPSQIEQKKYIYISYICVNFHSKEWNGASFMTLHINNTFVEKLPTKMLGKPNMQIRCSKIRDNFSTATATVKSHVKSSEPTSSTTQNLELNSKK